MLVNPREGFLSLQIPQHNFAEYLGSHQISYAKGIAGTVIQSDLTTKILVGSAMPYDPTIKSKIGSVTSRSMTDMF